MDTLYHSTVSSRFVLPIARCV